MFLLLEGSQLRHASQETSSTGEQEAFLKAKAFYNIFHPYDPVAHRVEPTVDRSWAGVKPYPIPYTKGGLTETITGMQNIGTEFVSRSFSMLENMRSSVVSTSMNVSGFFTSTSQIESDAKLETDETPKESVAADKESTDTVKLLNDAGRIDYCLQEGVLENQYISALGVHMNYWCDSDCAALILRSLYGIEHKLAIRVTKTSDSHTANTVKLSKQGP